MLLNWLVTLVFARRIQEERRQARIVELVYERGRLISEIYSGCYVMPELSRVEEKLRGLGVKL